MGHSQAGKAHNRERILAEAARQVRREGLESISVGALMSRVGLTHGGFYGHFDSRSDLLAQALERALTEGAERSRAQASGHPLDFAGLVRSYLSRTHRDAPETGCAIAALVSDAGRADAASRVVMSEHIDSFVRSVADDLDGDEARAAVAVSAMVGALALSRVIADPARSDALLRAVRDYVAAMEEGSQA
jgi:TetR/AcrR family transcriptional repressor of nem operon